MIGREHVAYNCSKALHVCCALQSRGGVGLGQLPCQTVTEKSPARCLLLITASGGELKRGAPAFRGTNIHTTSPSQQPSPCASAAVRRRETVADRRPGIHAQKDLSLNILALFPAAICMSLAYDPGLGESSITHDLFGAKQPKDAKRTCTPVRTLPLYPISHIWRNLGLNSLEFCALFSSNPEQPIKFNNLHDLPRINLYVTS